MGINETKFTNRETSKIHIPNKRKQRKENAKNQHLKWKWNMEMEMEHT